MNQLIASKQARLQRNQEKMATVIQFLKEEVYSDITNLTLLLQYKSRRPLDRLLNKLIHLGYLHKHEFEFQSI